MSSKYTLDADGNPVRCDDLLAWATWYESSDEARRVARDTVGEVEVSTVFLSIDHGWSGTPVLYETMTFGGAPRIDEWCRRYATRAEALAGHAETVRAVRAALGA